MAEQDKSQEKIHDPTPQRLLRARREGNVPQSKDVNTAASYIALLAAMAVASGGMTIGFATPLISFLGAPTILAEQIAGPGGTAIAMSAINQALWAVAPILAAPAIGVLVAVLAQRAFVVSGKKILPKLSRLSPIENAKQKFGAQGIVEFVKSSVKLFAVGAVLGVVFYAERDELVALMVLDARQLPELMYEKLMIMLLAATVIVGAIAALDISWQRYSHRRRLRMSHKELRDEMKTIEGDPYFRQTRRDRGRKIAMSQMMQDVPKADVVVVNPTHYAVALQWIREPGAAPICVAKGVDAIAMMIREVAEANNVPIHSDPPTARALEATVEIGEEIHPDHYQAVAVAIRFADTVRKRARARL